MKDNLIFKQQDNQMYGYEECNNYIGFAEIEIIEFNYDGKGNALILEDGDLGYMSEEDLRFVFFSGWYKGHSNNQLITLGIANSEVDNLGNYNLDDNYELTNLNNSPLLKRLLSNYMINQYQEAVDLSEESLWIEYQYLLKHNELNKIFVQESLDNSYGL